MGPSTAIHPLQKESKPAMAKRSVIVQESGDGPYSEVVTVGPHLSRADEDEAFGGGDAGPSPYEYVMAGLGACTAMTLRMYATRRGWPLAQVTVTVSHKVVVSAGQEGPKDRFERVIRVEGDALTEEQRSHLLEIADKCPVSQTLQRASQVISSLAETEASDA